MGLLASTPYNDGVVLFNGTNNDAASKRIYADWMKRHAGTDRVTGSRTADTRAALVEHFREYGNDGKGPNGSIMIATEAGAEGINLQFCSMVINYDLPWNPQRIEQRIGRCHRYGQKHDVVVVNFINRDNVADKRVYELLDQKFKLFEGVFGASDEVLGAVESGVDFERRIAEIYQTCRQPEYIPDFVVQLPDMVLLIETKKAQEVAAAQESDTDVKAKAEQATLWCKHASDYAKTVGGKPWRYLLVPHDAVAANVTLENLVARYGTA